MTSIRRLIDRLLENWIAKVASLLIAILLYIFYQASQIDKKTFMVPLKIVEDGVVMHIGNVPKSVLVVVRTNDTIMNMINGSDFEGSIDISYITEPGTYNVPVEITLSPKLKELDPLEVILKESEIPVKVDNRITKYIPLSPSVVGEVAHGYAISQISISPSTVEVTGPQSIVDAITSIPTERIKVSNAENNFSVETSWLEQNKLISIKDEGPLIATVSLSADVMEKEFTDIKVDVTGLVPNLEITNMLPSVSVTLSGEVPVLEKYSVSGRVVYVNLREYTEPGTYDIPVRYNFPSAFSIISKSLDSVTVVLETVQEDEAAGTDDEAGPMPEEGAAAE